MDRGVFIFPTPLSSAASPLSQGFAFLFAQQTPSKLKDSYCTAATIAKTNHPESKLANELVLPGAGTKLINFGARLKKHHLFEMYLSPAE